MDSARGRITRRRSSAGPQPAIPPRRPRDLPASGRSTARATFLTLRDHGKVYVADLPRLSDGQLSLVGREAREVLESLSRRLQELDQSLVLSPAEQETRIRASTKRSVTERFIQAVEDEQEQRRSNPALQSAARESLARAFLEIARHRLAGATFDSLLQEALAACGDSLSDPGDSPGEGGGSRPPTVVVTVPRPSSLPVVLSPDPGSATAGA